MGDSRHPRHARNQVRLRHRRERRVHGAYGRQRRALLHHHARRCGRARDRHHRGSQPRWHSPGAARLASWQRSAMRLLPAWPDHAGRGTAPANAEAHRPANHRCHVGKHLQVRHLFADPCGHQVSRGDHGMTTIVKVRRRDVIKGMAGMTGLVLGFHVGLRNFPFAEAATTTTFEPNVYLAIDETGLVTIVAHRPEMGTGIRTGLPMVLADELEADWTRVKVIQAQGDPKYGDQNTDGSRSMRQFYQPMREAGASARQMLEAAAAHMWSVDANDCRARNHMVVHVPTGRQLSFGDVAKIAATLQVPPADHLELRFKPASERRYIGKPIPIVDLNDIVRGKATYGIDVVLPGMKYASVERCPVYGGKVLNFDAADALKVPGVEQVLEIRATPVPSGFDPLGGVAVIATNTWAAQQGRQKLKITWEFGPNASHDSSAYRGQLEATAKQPGHVVREQGK